MYADGSILVKFWENVPSGKLVVCADIETAIIGLYQPDGGVTARYY